MKPFKSCILAVSILFPAISPSALAGGVSDGGGNAVVCKNGAGEVTAELLDLYEAEAQLGIKPAAPTQDDPVEIAVLAAREIGKGSPEESGSLEMSIRDIAARMRILPAGIGLKAVPDSNHILIPKNCEIVQAAVYRDQKNEIFVDGDIYNRMDKVHKAALLVHEALYRHLRSYGEETSSRTRQAVALAFSGESLEPHELPAHASPRHPRWCESETKEKNGMPKFSFAMYGAENMAWLQFAVFDGKIMFTRTIASVSGESWPRIGRESFTVTSLDSKIDRGTAIYIRLLPSSSGTTIRGFIDTLPTTYLDLVRTNPPGHRFVCRPQ